MVPNVVVDTGAPEAVVRFVMWARFA